MIRNKGCPVASFQLPLSIQAFGKLTARIAFSCACAVGIVLVSGCSSRPITHAPVEDRSASRSRLPVVSANNTLSIKQPAGFENAGKAGYYSVKPGDTLIRIGLDSGQNWRDIARWNGIDNPNIIEVDQVLRVAPPGVDNSHAVTQPVTSGSAVASASAPTAPQPAASAPKPAATAASAPATPVISSSGNGTTIGSAGEDELAWIWPAQGSLIAGFDESKNKGFDISGKAGDPIIATADGRVVYAGAGLRGYGNLIILKHNNTYLTAYAHSQTLLVKEDQAVKKGQKIAEMGSSDADRVKLHFEIRRQGKPVDPAKYLPAK